jgi:hypothetical protein
MIRMEITSPGPRQPAQSPRHESPSTDFRMNYFGFALPLALPHGFVSGAALFANLTRSR